MRQREPVGIKERDGKRRPLFLIVEDLLELDGRKNPQNLLPVLHPKTKKHYILHIIEPKICNI